MPSTNLTHTHCSFFKRGLVVLLAGRRGARETVKVEWKVVHAVGQAHALGVEQWVARYAGQLREVWWERTVDRARNWEHTWRTKDAVLLLLLLLLWLRWGGWLAARAGPARLGGGGTRTSNLIKNTVGARKPNSENRTLFENGTIFCSNFERLISNVSIFGRLA